MSKPMSQHHAKPLKTRNPESPTKTFSTNHDQPQLRRVGCRVRRPEDDDRSTRSSYPPLPHSRNRKRQLPLQEQLGDSRQTRKGESTELDERLIPKPSSSRVSSQWKSRVSSRRKSTLSGRETSRRSQSLTRSLVKGHTDVRTS